MSLRVEEMSPHYVRLVFVLDCCVALWFFYWTFANGMVIWRQPLLACLYLLSVTSFCMSILFLILFSWETGLNFLVDRRSVNGPEGGFDQKKRTTKITVLLIVFTALTAISVLSVYSASQMSWEKEETLVLCKYRHMATYDYTAILKPNIVYEKLTLRPGEGSIYQRITDQIIVNLTYSLASTLPANITLNAVTTETLQVADLEKQLSNAWTFRTNATGSAAVVAFDRIEPLQISTIRGLVSNITKETGLGFASEYYVSIDSAIQIEASTTEGIIEETFNPSLVFAFRSGSRTGQIIQPSDLQHTQAGSITRTQRTGQNPAVATWYMVSTLLSIASLSGLAYMVYVFRKTKPSMEHQYIFIEDIVEPYEEIIVEASEAASDKGQTTTPISSLEDLVKIADIIGRPILHVQKPPNTHAFYVIDGPTIYEYTTTAKRLAEPEEVEVEIQVESEEENER